MTTKMYRLQAAEENRLTVVESKAPGFIVLPMGDSTFQVVTSWEDDRRGYMSRDEALKRTEKMCFDALLDLML